MLRKILCNLMGIVLALSGMAVLSTSASAEILGDDYPNKNSCTGCHSIYNGDDHNDYNYRAFYYRQCTDFVAWRLNNTNGVYFTNSYGGVTWSDASNWGYAAQSIGITVDVNPAVGSIAWWSGGNYGHVAWVAGVNGDNVDIEEYNGPNSAYKYNSRTINKWNPSGYIHIKDMNSDTHYGAEIVNFDGANASNISFFDATIGCWMRNPISYNIRSYGFYLGNNQSELVQYTIGQNVKWTDSYLQANLSDYVGRLSQGVTYYYRFFSLTDGYNLSPIYSFTTSGNSTVTFDNVVSSNMDNDNMSIECWARNHQGLNIKKYGLYYGTSVNEMNECIEVGNNVSWTDFHISLKIIDQNIELKPNTIYYYQFFALTDGWNFSPVSSFTLGDYVPRQYPTTPTEPSINPTEPSLIKLGDVDGDEEVTIIDATCIQRKLANIPTAAFIEAAADADGDGEVTIIDATSIQRHLAQLLALEAIGKPIS